MKGVLKSADGNVTLVVEGGGTIVFDSEGIVDATGIAKTLLASYLQTENKTDSLDIADGDNFRRALGRGVGCGRSGCLPTEGLIRNVGRYFISGEEVLVNSQHMRAGNLYINCCIPGHNDAGIVTLRAAANGQGTSGREGTPGEYRVYDDDSDTQLAKAKACRNLCRENPDCKTADTWHNKCYMSRSGPSNARPYPGCTMFVDREGYSNGNELIPRACTTIEDVPMDIP